MVSIINLLINLFDTIKVKALECVSVVNKKCMARSKIIDTNANEPVFYPLSVKVNKCSGSCNTINDPMAKLCVPDIVKDLNLKVFNMMSRINETRKVIWHETCKCVCRLTSAICYNKQDCNENKCKCECKEDLVGKLVCNSGYIWNPSTCECKCDKFYDIGQNLDYKNCVFRKNIDELIDDLIEQCTSIIDMPNNDNNMVCDAIKSVNNAADEVIKSDNNNVYMILFIVGLIVSAFLIGGVVFYCRKHNTKKLSDKIYDVIYSSTGKANY